MYKRQADELIAQGYRELGYVYVNIDDCWSMRERDQSNRLVADTKRFPSGIKALANYVSMKVCGACKHDIPWHEFRVMSFAFKPQMHDRGLKLGIYGDAGASTCAGYPGSMNYVAIDAQTFADWDVDMLKFDGCSVPDESNAGLSEFSAALAV